MEITQAEKEIDNLLGSIGTLKTNYDRERAKDRFNIISALHKMNDEKNLHSRFISYLLSPDSGHAMGNIYTRLFIREVLKLTNEQFDLSDFKVFPNEVFKTEYEFIDIVLVNERESQAIIIENKIDASDSNYLEIGNGYGGQLERYYNTIKTGRDKNKKFCKYQCDNVYVYYLSKDGNRPSDYSVGMLRKEPFNWSDDNLIFYESHIIEWLENCIKETPTEKSLERELINHYLKLIKKMTNNDTTIDERLELKRIVAGNTDSTQYLIENFKHIKWHTTDEFWEGLKKELQKQDYKNVRFYYPEINNWEKTITQITHSVTKQAINFGILFDLKNGTNAYISGERELSWGIIEPHRWTTFDGENIEGINFSSFSSVNTYRLIDSTKMLEAIELIIKEISDSESNGLKNLKPNLENEKSLQL